VREPLTGPAAPARAAVLGSPIGHSLSPAMHRAAYAALGLSGWTYQAFDVDEAGLTAFLAALGQGWAGLSLTMPLKRAVVPHLSGLSPLAAAVGAVNTVLPDDSGSPDGRRRSLRPGALLGENTDVPGLVAALRAAGVGRVCRAAVLGGGATATSALAALRELGCTRPTVYVRSGARAADLFEAAGRLGVAPVLADWDRGPEAFAGEVVVSTVPAGAADELAERLAGTGSPGEAVLLDVVYAGWPTRLARVRSGQGAVVVNGLELLLHQAAEQVRLMTGQAAPVEAMRRAALGELDRRAATPSG
jgi:shikimate dehydrogenase